MSYSLSSSLDTTILWNPAIHKYVSLPLLPYPSHVEKANKKFDPLHDTLISRFQCNAIGFGHDNSKNDFKVVRIWMADNSTTKIPTLAEIYSTREGTWRSAIAPDTDSYRSSISMSKTGCFVNGAIHWLVETYILTFDCKCEEFRTTMELPQQLYSKSNSVPLDLSSLWEYGGMLSLLTMLRGDNFIQLWVMEKHDLHNEWKKLYNIGTGILLSEISFNKLAPFGPYQWTHHLHDLYVSTWFGQRGLPASSSTLFGHILSYHVYEESMFFMDDPDIPTYT